MPNIVNISILGNFYDKETTQCDPTWEVLCQYLSESRMIGDKMDAPLFNGCKYQNTSPELSEVDGQSCANRKKTDLMSMSVLIIDFDNKEADHPLTIEQAKSLYGEYAHFGYTSHSHTPDQHRFRLLFPLETSIPMQWDENTRCNGIWEQLVPALKRLFPAGDPASFHANQFFFIPTCPPSGESDATHWCVEGNCLDWQKLELTPISTQSTPVEGDESGRGLLPAGPYLHPDQLLSTEQGKIVVKDIKSRIQKVKCPFHEDRRGTEFVNVIYGSGLPFLYCKRCARNFYMYDPNHAPDKNSRLKLLAALDFGESIFDKTYQSHEDRAHIQNVLDDSLQKIIGGDDYHDGRLVLKPNSHVLYMPEGSGKSRLVISLAALGYKVLFATKSYAQLNEKLEEFRNAGHEFGFEVGAIRSLDGVLQACYGVKAVRHNKNPNPFKLAKINLQETIDEIVRRNPGVNKDMIRMRIAFAGSDSRYSFPLGDGRSQASGIEGPNIVVTTFTMLRMLQVIKNIPPASWTVWVDDPDPSDMMDIAPVPEAVLATKLGSGNMTSYTPFFYRDSLQSFVNIFKARRLIFTTTELNTLKLTEHVLRQRRNPYHIHDEMHNIAGGHITILGTEKVRKAYDGVLPVIISTVSKQLNRDVLLIADGLSSAYNHSNSKGKNTLQNQDTVLEISIPHPQDTNTLCAALHGDPAKKFLDLRIDSMLDKLHQGLGRNTGYRSKGAEAVALVDPMHHSKIVAACRYQLDRENSQIIDKLQSLSRLDKRISDSATPLVVALEDLINNPDKLFLDNRKAKPAITRVVTQIQDTDKRVEYLARLSIGLANVGRVNLTARPVKPSERQLSYIALVNWVLDQHASFEIRERVEAIITQYFETQNREADPSDTP